VAEDVKADGQHVSASLVVQDAAAIALIDSKARRELSCGYQCSLELTSGVAQGEHYDAIQRDIRYNHVALGPDGWGRAGSSVALRLDSGDAIQINPTTEHAMKITIDGKEYDAGSPEAVTALAKLTADRDAAKGRADGLDVQVKTLGTELAAAKDPKAIAARVKVRSDLVVTARALAKAKGLVFDEAAAEGQNDLEMMGAMIKIMDPAFDPTGKSEDFVRGMFSAFVTVAATTAEKQASTENPAAVTETPAATGTTEAAAATGTPAAAKTDGGIFKARETVDGQTKASGAPVNAEDARKRADAASKSAWQKPLAMSKETK
jgi:hypothetical protein